MVFSRHCRRVGIAPGAARVEDARRYTGGGGRGVRGMSGCGLGGRVLLNAPLRRLYSHAHPKRLRDATVVLPPSGEDVAKRQKGGRVSKAHQNKKGPRRKSRALFLLFRPGT